jgi:hypothetical protein
MRADWTRRQKMKGRKGKPKPPKLKDPGSNDR